uniref:Fibrinogen C-terminal domain-containing protein n=1 Tax=Amphimedon queenslandica TaxID=400682 RepID=A0A1X7URF0_AMPQE
MLSLFLVLALTVALSTSQEFSFTASCGGGTGLESSANNSNCKALGYKIDQLVSAMPAAYKELASRKKNGSSIDAFSWPPPSYIPSSCQDIKDNWPNSGSGYYNIATMNGKTQPVYCQMEGLCNITGAWTRIAYLDMSDPTQTCPSAFSYSTSENYRTCGRGFSSGCSPLYFSPPQSGYQQICGRIVGYQYGAANSFSHSTSIDSNYVHGISLTHGSTPRKHIWTFGVGNFDNVAHYLNCPCSSGSPSSVPSFVGKDYFCESGISGSLVSRKLYSSDPLWDGTGCGSLEGDCCAAPGLPWFHKDLGSRVTKPLEMRICSKNSSGDIKVSLYELYVK